MSANENPTAKGGRVSRNALVGASAESFNPSRQLLQLPPIIACHLWRPDEIALIEASVMAMLPLLGGTSHG